MYTILIENDNLLAITTNEKIDYAPSNPNYQNNLDNLALQLGIKSNQIFRPSQTHSDHFVEVTMNTQLPIEDCDALFTNVPERYLGVLTADCLPLLFHDTTTNYVGAIHAGWVGAVKLITYKTFKFLIEEKGLNPQTTKIMLCPSIAQSNYEVDDKVKDAVKACGLFDIEDLFINKENNKYLFDNRLFNIKQLLSLGFDLENILIDDKDTYSNNSYFSYREDKTTGRNLSLIGLKSSKTNYRKYFNTLKMVGGYQESNYIINELKELINKNNYKNIMAFLPFKDEVQILPLIEELANDPNKNIYVPQILDDTQMQAVKYDPSKIETSSLGCLQSTSQDVINPEDLDLIIVPALAFDKENNRLGRGKGFYDRFLAKTNAYKVGISYSIYVVDNLPTNQFDIKMDEVIYLKLPLAR